MYVLTPHNHIQSLAAARDQLGPTRAVPMLLGPLTFLWLGQCRPSSSQRVSKRARGLVVSLFPPFLAFLRRYPEHLHTAVAAPSPRQQEGGKAGGQEPMQVEEGEEGGASFEGMLAAVLPLYKALLQAVAALGFPYACSCLTY